MLIHFKEKFLLATHLFKQNSSTAFWENVITNYDLNKIYFAYEKDIVLLPDLKKKFSLSDCITFMHDV